MGRVPGHWYEYIVFSYEAVHIVMSTHEVNPNDNTKEIASMKKQRYVMVDTYVWRAAV